MILCLIKECCRIQQSLKLVFRAAIIFLVGIILRFKIVVFSHLLAKADSFPLLLLHLNRCIMLERIDTSSSNAPTHPGKVQIFQPQARMTNKYSWVAWGGDVEASNWLAELPKSPLLAASDMSLLWVPVPIDSFQLLPFFQKPELVVNDYDLRQLWKEWFIVGGWTVVIKKLHWNLSHQCRNDM